jgi:hypothetical protein
MRDHLMGYPPAIAHLADEQRVRRTPPRVRLSTDPWEREDWTHVAKHVVGAPPSDGVSAPEKAAPFKVGDRVRVRPGYIKGDPYSHGTVISISDFVDVQHDKSDFINPAGWCVGSLELLPSEWIEWLGGECPLKIGTKYEARMRDGREEIFECEEEDFSGISIFKHLVPLQDLVAYRVVAKP